MSRVVLLALLLAGCAHEEAVPQDVGTVRLFGEQRVIGNYVSPTAYQHYLRAQLAVLAGRGADAVDELRRALTSDGASPYLHTRLGEELMALGRLDEAREQLVIALELDPEFVEAFVDLGKIHMQLKELATGEKLFRRAIAIDRRCEEAYLSLATLYEKSGDLRRTEETLRVLVELLPQSAQGHYRLAQVARWHGAAARVEFELRRALEADPHLDEACRELGEQLIAQGQNEEAVSRLSPCFLRKLDAASARLLITAEENAGRPAVASEVLDRIANHPNGFANYLAAAGLLLDLNQGARALALLDAAAGEFPAHANKPSLLLLRSQILVALARGSEARTMLARIPPAAAEYASARIIWAHLACNENHCDTALNEMKRLLAVNEKSVDFEQISLALVDFHLKQGNWLAALTVLDSALATHPALLSLSLSRAHVLRQLGRLDEAEQVLRTLCQQQPPNANALSALADLLIERAAHLDEAKRLLETALALKPAAGKIADQLGYLYLTQGHMTEAEHYLNRAARLLGANPAVQTHLGTFYLKKGQRSEAVAAFNQALGSSPDDKLRHFIEEELLRLEEGKMGAR